MSSNGGKTLKKRAPPQIIPPASKTRANLVTIGDVRSEMGRVYNSMQRGVYSLEEMTKRIWALRQIGQTVEAAEKLGISADADNDQRPVFTGLQIVPPPADKLIDGPNSKPKGKADAEKP